MKKIYWIIGVFIILSNCLYAQNYVYVGISPMLFTKDLNPYLNESKSIKTNLLDNIYNQNSFRIQSKRSALFSFGYKKAFPKKLNLCIGAELADSRFALRQDDTEISTINLYSINIPISIQKEFTLNERLNLYLSGTLGFYFSFPGGGQNIAGTSGLTFNVIGYPNGNKDTLIINYRYFYAIEVPRVTVFTRAIGGLQYKFKNNSYIELGIGYNYNFAKDLLFWSSVSSFYNTPDNPLTQSKEAYSKYFRLPYFLAEVKYCIPLMPGRIKSKKAKKLE